MPYSRFRLPGSNKQKEKKAPPIVTANSPLLAPHPSFASAPSKQESRKKRKRRDRKKSTDSNVSSPEKTGGSNSAGALKQLESSSGASGGGRISRLSSHPILPVSSSRPPSRSSGAYQPLLCRSGGERLAATKDTKNSSSTLLTFENIYAAAEEAGSSSSDMMKQQSSSSEENLIVRSATDNGCSNQSHLQNDDLPPPSLYHHDYHHEECSSGSEQLKAALKPLSYPDDSLVTGASDSSSLLRTNIANSISSNDKYTIVDDSMLSPQASQLIFQSSESSDDDTEQENEEDANNNPTLEAEKPVGETTSSRQTVIINVDVDDEGDDRIISAVNYNVCSASANNICEEFLDQSESSEIQLFSAYENLTDEENSHAYCKVEVGDICENRKPPCSKDKFVECNKSVQEDETSSNPDIEWLFSHSDSDSEFAELAKGNSPQPSVNSKNTCCSIAENTPDVEIRKVRKCKEKRPSNRRSKSSAKSNLPESKAVRHSKTCRSARTDGNAESTMTNIQRRHDTSESDKQHHLQGAIPKRRRHGVIMDGLDEDTVAHCDPRLEEKLMHSGSETSTSDKKGVDDSTVGNLDSGTSSNKLDNSASSTPAGEVSSVTMDLMRRMLDVFSSYPEHCHIDIKKLLVMVSLEQQNSNNRATVTALGGVSEIDSNNASVDNNHSRGPSVATTNKSPGGSSTLPPQASPPSSALPPKHSTLPPSYNISPPPDVTHKLHRKPAVRRRKYGSAGGNSSPPVSPLDTSKEAYVPATTTFPGVSQENISYQPAVLTQEEVSGTLMIID